MSIIFKKGTIYFNFFWFLISIFFISTSVLHFSFQSMPDYGQASILARQSCSYSVGSNDPLSAPCSAHWVWLSWTQRVSSCSTKVCRFILYLSLTEILNRQRWIFRNPRGATSRLWAINPLHFPIGKMLALMQLFQSTWDTGVKTLLLWAAVRGLLWMLEHHSLASQAHVDGSKHCGMMWLEWGSLCSQGLHS